MWKTGSAPYGCLLYTSETKNVASSLTEDVTLYLLAEDGSEDATLNELLTRYADLSSHIKYEKKDPVLNPSFASSYTDEDLASNSVIVVSDKRSKVIPYSDLYESSVNYQTCLLYTSCAASDCPSAISCAAGALMELSTAPESSLPSVISSLPV